MSGPLSWQVSPLTTNFFYEAFNCKLRNYIKFNPADISKISGVNCWHPMLRRNSFEGAG